MTFKILLVLAACMIAFALVFGGVLAPVDKVDAQADYADRKGIEGLFAGGKDLSGKGPTTFQKFLGFGSVVVMVIVWKWL